MPCGGPGRHVSQEVEGFTLDISMRRAAVEPALSVPDSGHWNVCWTFYQEAVSSEGNKI